MNSHGVTFSRIHFKSAFNLVNKLWIHYLLREFTMNLLDVSRIYSEFTINFKISLVMNSLSVLRIYYEFTVYPESSKNWWCFAAFLWIQLMFREYSLWNNYIYRESTINSLYSSRTHYGFTVHIANLVKIHYLFREFTKKSLFVSRIHYRFITFFGEFTIFIKLYV